MNLPQITINNSYHFVCEFTEPAEISVQAPQLSSVDLDALYKKNPAWREATWLADKLNDLIEEYHAPGVPRKERRAIEREFDKVVHIFQKHCSKNRIKYTYQEV